MRTKTYNESVGKEEQISRLADLLKVLSIHFTICEPFINHYGNVGFSCENGRISAFCDYGEFNVFIGNDHHMARDITELNELITNRNK